MMDEFTDPIAEERIAAHRKALAVQQVSLPLELKRLSLTDVPLSLLDLEHLTCLYLEGNELTSLPDDFFVCLPMLHWLDLRNNALETLPCLAEGYAKCGLRHLLLEANRLTHLPNELGEASHLQGLSISRNPLEYPPASIVKRGVKVIIPFLYNALHNIEEPVSPASILPSLHTSRGKRKQKTPRPGRAPTLQQAATLPAAFNGDSLTAAITPAKRAAATLAAMERRALTAEELKQFYAHQQQQKQQLQRLEASQRDRPQYRLAAIKRGPATNQKSKEPPLHMAVTETLAAMNPPLSRLEGPLPQKSLLEQSDDKRRQQHKQEAKLQKKKDKDALSDWRQQRKREQRQAQYSQHRPGNAALPAVATNPPPYGTDADVRQPTEDSALTAAMQNLSHRESSVSKSIDEQVSREKRLQQRIQKHVEKMKRRDTEQHLSPRSKMEAARKDLEEALEHRQQLRKGDGNPEYRLSAFIATVDKKDNPSLD